jgi:sigma-B regulation protein RsbQ
MSVQTRNNVHIAGAGPATVIFTHGFGCDQTMWRSLAHVFASRYRTITYDLVGSGESDRSAYDRSKYASLHGYAQDLIEIADLYGPGPLILVGHSVGAMIGLLATIDAPGKFAGQVMVGPTPCFINDDDYVGGFNHEELDELIALMDSNIVDWSNYLAPAIMGAPDRPELGRELARSFRRNDPSITRQFARATFYADHRADLPKSRVPALVLQSSNDLIVPREVGDYMLRHLPNATLETVDNVGHCPHVSAPSTVGQAVAAFIERMLAPQP